MEENLEQPILDEQGSKPYGKFKDAESLLKAYNNLEAEFTKKSQKLSLLESESEKENLLNQKREEQTKQVEEFVSKFEFIKPFSSALKESLSNGETDLKEQALNLISKSYKTAEAYSQDEEFLNNYIYSNSSIKDKIVKDYLNKLPQSSPIKMDGSSKSISLTPPTAPKNIQEASRLAKSIIKQK